MDPLFIVEIIYFGYKGKKNIWNYQVHNGSQGKKSSLWEHVTSPYLAYFYKKYTKSAE